MAACWRRLLLPWPIQHEHSISINANSLAGVSCTNACARASASWSVARCTHSSRWKVVLTWTDVVTTREAAVPFLSSKPKALRLGYKFRLPSNTTINQMWGGGSNANSGLNSEVVSQNIVPRFLLSNILIRRWPLVHIIEVKNDDPSLDYASHHPPPLLL